MRHQHRWCVIVWISERASQVCWIWPRVYTVRADSVVNLACDIHNTLHKSHLSDSLSLVILLHQKFDGKQCMIDLIVLLWSWYRTFVFFSHSPSLSRLSHSVKSQSPVKVEVMTPFLCSRQVPSSVVRSLFLDVWHSHEKAPLQYVNFQNFEDFYFPCLLSNVIVHRVSPDRGLKNLCFPLLYGPLVHGLAGQVVPYRFPVPWPWLTELLSLLLLFFEVLKWCHLECLHPVI